MKSLREGARLAGFSAPLSVRSVAQRLGFSPPISLTTLLRSVDSRPVTVAKFSGSIVSGGLAALGGSVEVTIDSTGFTQWRGHAHDSGADGYDFGVTAVLSNRLGKAIAFAHYGHVGGTFTSGSRNHDWDEPHPPQGWIAQQYSNFEHGDFQVYTEYTSDIASTLESAMGAIGRFLIGSTPLGVALGVIVFVGTEVGSLISTGSLVPGARIIQGVLWLAGPSNILLALAAEGIASAGSRTRELTDEEYRWANDEVYSGTLPPKDRIVLTDTIGAQNRAFTFPRFDGKITLNMGPDVFDDPRNSRVNEQDGDGWTIRRGEVFIHELAHAWQIAHTPIDLVFIADALATTACQVTGHNPYHYGPAGPAYSSFNIEQQAQIVNEWFSGKKTGSVKDENSPYYQYIIRNIRTGQYDGAAFS